MHEIREQPAKFDCLQIKGNVDGSSISVQSVLPKTGESRGNSAHHLSPPTLLSVLAAIHTGKFIAYFIL